MDQNSRSRELPECGFGRGDVFWPADQLQNGSALTAGCSRAQNWLIGCYGEHVRSFGSAGRNRILPMWLEHLCRDFFGPSVNMIESESPGPLQAMGRVCPRVRCLSAGTATLQGATSTLSSTERRPLARKCSRRIIDPRATVPNVDTTGEDFSA
jgi:hypothetical protein